MTAADMAELCARIREPGVAKTLRCVRMGPPVDNDGALPDDLVSGGLMPLLSGPRRLEVRQADSTCKPANGLEYFSKATAVQIGAGHAILVDISLPSEDPFCRTLLPTCVAAVQTLYLWGAVTVTQRDTLVASLGAQGEAHGGYGYETTGELAGSVRFSSVPG